MNWKLNLTAGFLLVSLAGSILLISPRSEATSNHPNTHQNPGLHLAQKKAPAPEPSPVSAPTPGPGPALTTIEGVITAGTLYDILTRQGVPAAEVVSLSKAFEPVFDFRNVRPDDTYQATVDSGHRIYRFVYRTRLLDEYEATRKPEGGGYIVEKRKIDVRAEKPAVPAPASASTSAPVLTTIEGVITAGTLYETLTARDVPAAEVMALSHALKPLFDFRNARPKDAYQATVDSTNRIQKFVYRTRFLDEYEAVKNTEGGGYTVHKRKAATNAAPVAEALVATAPVAVVPAVAPKPAAEPKLTTVEGVITAGTLYETLTACDIPAAEVMSLSHAFKPVFDFRNVRPKDSYQATLDDKRCIQKFVYKTGLLDEYEAVKNPKANGYTVRKREIAVDTDVVSRVFTVGTSLYQAVADHSESPQMTAMIADIFAWDIDFYTYPRKGDRIAVVYERCSLNGRFVRYGKILAVRYESPRKTFSAFFFNDGHFDGYYDEAGRPLKNMFLRTPLQFGRVTSGYTTRRFHPISKVYKAHTGIDYGAPTGTPILATANGHVTFSGWKNGYGKLTILKHPNGYETYYGHCSQLLMKPGQRVLQGQTIAKVGQTGVATGPHVHYEVRISGKPVDPVGVKKNQMPPLKPALLARFKKMAGERILLVEKALTETPQKIGRATEANPSSKEKTAGDNELG
ncbi:M23 family metallopeptidase [Desulfosarcina sp. OttesenSCG-928-B08]|nr:M23 family metallopeptidase [Desulfosarcina sp. OttesenSCG-928-B08]